MSGRVGDLSIQQEETLEQFRLMLSDVLEPHHDDYFLLRWLRAYKFDVEKGKAAVCKTEHWREKWKIDTILTDYVVPELYERFFPGGHLGFDKEGSPVMYIPFAADAFDWDGGVKANTTKGHLRHITYLIEQDIQYGKENSKRLGKVIEQQSYIIDAKDCSIRLAWNKKALLLIYKVILLFEKHYPERLKKIYVINFLPILKLLYKIAKRYIKEDIFKKFQFLSREGYQEALLKDIDAEVLPAFLGGTRVDPDGDPRCPSVIKPGGIIDPKYYLKSPRCEFSEQTDIKMVVVDAKSEEFIEVPVGQSDTMIQCEFLTDYYDIGFGVLYKTPGSPHLESLVPTERVDYSDDPIHREFHCTKPGIYVLQFDNTYSWFRQKEVKYRIELTTLEVNAQEPRVTVEDFQNYRNEVDLSPS